MSNSPTVLGRAVSALPPFAERIPWIGSDLQTLKNTICFDPPDFAALPNRRLHLPLRDGSGDELWTMLNLPMEDDGRPLVVLIHGLTGGELSRNIRASAVYHLSRGFPVLRLNLRNAGPSLGKCRHIYHAGRSQDLRDAITALPADLLARGLFLVGVSLGGNLLLKYLAERLELDDVIGAASVCAPINLKAAQQQIMSPRNSLYQRHLVQSLIRDAKRLVGEPVSAETLRSVSTIYELDDRVVAPLGGFDGADDYYHRCSAAPLLPSIEKPTLLIASSNDPWIPIATYRQRAWKSDGVLTAAITTGGGHVGFHGKGSLVPWHDRAIGAFIDSLF